MPVHLFNHETQGTAYASKATPVSADRIYLGDSADTWATVFATVGDLSASLGADTSLTTGVLATAGGSREAHFGGNALTMDDITSAVVSSSVSHTIQSPTVIIDHPTAATPGQLVFNDNDDSHTVGFIAPPTVTTSTRIQLPAAAGSTGDTLEVTGIAADIVQTDWLPKVVDSNITTGTVIAAAGARSIAFGTNSLAFTGLTTFDVTASGVSTIDTTLLHVKSPTASVGAEIRLEDGDKTADVSFRAAPNMTDTFTVIMPVGAGTANQVMSIASVASDELTMTWTTTGGTDTFLGSTDQTLTGARAITMGANDLNIGSSGGNVKLTGGDYAKIGAGATCMRLQSPDTSWWAIQIDNEGAISTVASGAP